MFGVEDRFCGCPCPLKAAKGMRKGIITLGKLQRPKEFPISQQNQKRMGYTAGNHPRMAATKSQFFLITHRHCLQKPLEWLSVGQRGCRSLRCEVLGLVLHQQAFEPSISVDESYNFEGWSRYKERESSVFKSIVISFSITHFLFVRLPFWCFFSMPMPLKAHVNWLLGGSPLRIVTCYRDIDHEFGQES